MKLLAYADYLVLVSPGREQLQRAIDAAAESASAAELSFNTRQCATLHVDGKRRTTMATKFILENQPLSALSEDGMYEYLGTPTGYRRARSVDELVQGLGTTVDRIDASLLAP